MSNHDAKSWPRLSLQALMIGVAAVAIVIWLWLYFPEWWSYHQAMKTLTG